jgi:hypothetical protein
MQLEKCFLEKLFPSRINFFRLARYKFQLFIYSAKYSMQYRRDLQCLISECIWNNLCSEFMALPDTSDKWKQIAEGFETKANFPHCIGAVDGRHISHKD